MAKSLKMVFAVGDAKTATFSLAEPKDGLTKAEVQTALDEMVEKKAITVFGLSFFRMLSRRGRARRFFSWRAG